MTDQGSLAVLQLLHVRKCFDSTVAVSDASLTVGVGEVVALVGRSGSGKSTILLCSAGILRPDSGDVYYRGRRLAGESDRTLSRLRRSEFGFIFQFGQLVSELTALENVALPLLLAGRRRREALTAAHEWLARLNLQDLGLRRPSQLSGGQAQRVAVARAMVVKPQVIFADEPTGALDSEAAEVVMQTFIEAARSRRVSVVLVTHEPWVAAYADRRVTVADGFVHDGASFNTTPDVHLKLGDPTGRS